jgi:hypothetical protein
LLNYGNLFDFRQSPATGSTLCSPSPPLAAPSVPSSSNLDKGGHSSARINWKFPGHGRGIGLTFQSIGRVGVHLSQGPATFLEKFQMGACEFGASPILSGMNRLGEFVNVVRVKTPEHSVTTGYGTQRCPPWAPGRRRRLYCDLYCNPALNTEFLGVLPVITYETKMRRNPCQPWIPAHSVLLSHTLQIEFGTRRSEVQILSPRPISLL